MFSKLRIQQVSSLNQVQLIGNLGRDPESRRLNNGSQVVSFSLATAETWRDKSSGERKEKTEWHNVVVFNENIAKVVEQYCKKGSKVYIQGKLQTRKWQDQSGADKYTTEIVLQAFDSKLVLLSEREETKERAPSLQPARSSQVATRAGRDQFDDEEIPF